MSGSPNLLGIDVAGLDVPGFLAGARGLYPFLVLAWLAALVRWKRPAWVLMGVLAANGYAFFETNYPLRRLYAVDSRDRLNNLGMCQVVAAGNSPLETWQVGQTHFDPHGRPHNLPWVALVAALAGFNPDRVFVVYAFLPLAMMWGFAVALYVGFGSPQVTSGAWSPLERALASGFATLLASSPLDSTGFYRVPWAMTFLLKPNHALALVLLPPFLRAFASIRGWRSRVGVGLLLQLLGWAFVLHAVYVAIGLLVFAASSLAQRDRAARRDLVDVLTVLAVNAVLVVPAALWFLARLSGSPLSVLALGAAVLPPAPHLLEPTLRPGWVFFLGVYGAFRAQRRGDRLGRLLAAQVTGGLLLWVGYYGLSAFGWAEQPDEIFYWLRFLTAAAAGIGAWDLAGRCLPALFHRDLVPALRAAVVGLLVLPWTLPYWWDPAEMDSYFTRSLEPAPALLTQTGEFLRHETDPRAVLVGDPYFAVYAAAFGARRSLTSMGLPPSRDIKRRWQVEETLIQSHDPHVVRAAAASYGVTHLVVTPFVLSNYGLSLADFELRPFWERVWLWRETGRGRGFVAIFRLGPPAS